jgi:hypothetical protein
MASEREGLAAVIHALWLTQETTPARWAEDTADELLTLVQITFHDYVAAVLAEPMPDGLPGDYVPLAPRAALHARAIADLLTALAVSYWNETGTELSELGKAEAPVVLTARWIDEIADAARSDHGDHPRNAAEYVRRSATALSFVARILRAERGFSIDPEDPRGPVDLPSDAATGQDAGALLISCGAAALRIAAPAPTEIRYRAVNRLTYLREGGMP